MKSSSEDNDLLKRFMEAAAGKDIASLKEIKEEISRDRWLRQWEVNGSKMTDWLELNPFVEFK